MVERGGAVFGGDVTHRGGQGVALDFIPQMCWSPGTSEGSQIRARLGHMVFSYHYFMEVLGPGGDVLDPFTVAIVPTG